MRGRRTDRHPLRRSFLLAGCLSLMMSLLAACTLSAQPRTTVEPEPKPERPATAVAVPPTLSLPDPTATPVDSAAIRVSPDDAAIEVLEVDFPGDDAILRGYMARPREIGPFPVVLVAHDSRGLTEHFRDVTRRLAKAGYVALAVDLLSREGGTSHVSDQAQMQSALGDVQVDQFVRDFQSALRYLQMLEGAREERVGMLGFGFGGTVAWHVAAQTPSLRAAAVFYGSPPPVDQLTSLQAAVLGLYGGRDEQTTRDLPGLEKALRERHRIFERVVYPGAAAGFHDDTDPRYDPAAASDAWEKTLSWFDRHLQA